MQQFFSNPVMHPGPDPWIYKHTDGFYYMMVTLRDRLDLFRSRKLSQIAGGERKTIWTPPAEGPDSKDLWAPELHFIDGAWYVYYTANDGSGDPGRRIFVLENKSADPFAETWEPKGCVNTALPGLDGTVLRHQGRLYFLYAGYGHFPDYGSAIYIAAMSNPWTLSGAETLLTKPEYDWEKQGGMAINEGPVILKRNGRIFMVFSASTTWSDDYCLGMLTANEDQDLLNAEVWHKTSTPVFTKNAEGQVFGPGHNSFTVSPDETEDWIVYHAFGSSGAGAADRSLRLQPFGWHPDGTPDFGRPAAPGRLNVPSGE